MRRQAYLVFLGVLLSALIAGISAVFIVAEATASHVLWHNTFAEGEFRVVHHALVCAGGLLLTYALKKRWGDLPRTTHDSLVELKTHQTVTYTRMWRSLIIAAIILTTGAGVGPEACLLGAVIALSVWQADKLRFIYHNWDEFRTAPLTKRLAFAFHPRKYLLPYPQSPYRVNERKKQVLIGLYIANGIVMFTILLRLASQPSFVTHMGNTHWQLRELAILPALALGTAVVTAIYRWLRRTLIRGAERIHLPLFAKLAVGTLAVFAVSLAAPELMFSGQHEITFALHAPALYPAAILVLLALAKIFYLDLCVWAGWIGGDIFPILFSSVLLGFTAAQLLPGHDALFVCIIVATSFSTMLVDLTWAMCVIVALFFPLPLFPVALASTVLTQGVRRGIGWCKKKATRRNSH